jgi:NADH:ubiquinone oxidoreductase subunit E
MPPQDALKHLGMTTSPKAWLRRVGELQQNEAATRKIASASCDRPKQRGIITGFVTLIRQSTACQEKDVFMPAEEVTCAGCSEATEGELLVRLDDVLKEYAGVSGALIPVLQIAQAMFGYLPDEALKKIALALKKPYSEVAGVVGFYSFFSTVPRGKHLVRVCLGTACYVRGGKQVLAALRDALRIEIGETSSDRLFSLDVGRCFGACGLAPVIMIDDDVHQRVKPTRVAKILDQYRDHGVAADNGEGEE